MGREEVESLPMETLESIQKNLEQQNLRLSQQLHEFDKGMSKSFGLIGQLAPAYREEHGKEIEQMMVPLKRKREHVQELLANCHSDLHQVNEVISAQQDKVDSAFSCNAP